MTSRKSDVPIPKLAGVCGWPIHHSLSPVLHNYWLKAAGISGAYIPFAVRPDNAVAAFQSLKYTSISGVNVTLPLKRQAFLAADDHTPDALKLGVSNCLFKRDGKLIGHNTDLEGFATPLLSKIAASELSQSSVLLIGAGGASRAVIGALLSLNVPEIKIANRTDSKAESLAESVNLPSLYAVPWESRNAAVASSQVIINASSAGMSGYSDLDLDLETARPGTLVYDLIYTPRRTGLLKEAERRGCETLGGLSMLIEQARPSFRHFFGEAPPKDLDPTETLYAALKSGVR
ncbi:shikimate dehydrogenase [Litorimonas haliclonae]|uniref:shikimate dehydrogenase n=1 Tax=Litorimonas haliclonae TaxID=2081977 RepID=UPI0039F090D2